MSDGFTALCSDFYINQKLALKLDLPNRRETVLDLFDRVRKTLPRMDQFRRYEDELALESDAESSAYSWLALRQTSIRSGWVNPRSPDQAYHLHKLILEIAPYFLSISAMDVEFLELIFGFDLAADVNRNEVVFDALLSQSPLAGLIDHSDECLNDIQPFMGICLNNRCDLKAFVEVKTHTHAREVAERRFSEQPISVYLTVRSDGPIADLNDLQTRFATLAGYAERIAEQRVIPHILLPLRETLYSHPG